MERENHPHGSKATSHKETLLSEVSLCSLSLSLLCVCVCAPHSTRSSEGLTLSFHTTTIVANGEMQDIHHGNSNKISSAVVAKTPDAIFFTRKVIENILPAPIMY